MVLYTATGNLWPNPAVITISFVPDGTNLGGGVSNMFATFNANPALANKWQSQILQGAQLWAQQTNINFVVVPDDGAPTGSGSYEQGDPNHGDIRIGGYNFGSGNPALATTYQPPPVNNYSVAGDLTLNTGQTFNIGSTYDLMTVAAHEVGHALGLDHSSVSSSVEMYATYTGKKNLASDDIAGIESIYSNGQPRSTDAYNGANGTMATATNLDSTIGSSTSALVPDLDITKAGQVEFFSFHAPAGATTLKVSVQSSNLSLLAPKLLIYSATQAAPLATVSGAGTFGTTLTATVNNLVPGQLYYVKVQGADNTADGTGRYALGLSFDGSTPPTEASYIVSVLNGKVRHSGGGSAGVHNGQNALMAYTTADGDSFAVATATITGMTHDTGLSSTDGITADPRFNLEGTAPAGMTVLVYRDGKAVGSAKADAHDTWTFRPRGEGLTDGTYSFTAVLVSDSGEISPPTDPFVVKVDTRAPAVPVILSATLPTISGTAEPNSTVTLFAQGSTKPVGTATADARGNWSLSLPTNLVLPGHARMIVAVATDLAGNTSKPSARTELLASVSDPPAPVTGLL